MGPNAVDRYFIRLGLSCVHATLKLFLNYPSIKALDGATDHAMVCVAKAPDPPLHLCPPVTPFTFLHHVEKMHTDVDAYTRRHTRHKSTHIQSCVCRSSLSLSPSSSVSHHL